MTVINNSKEQIQLSCYQRIRHSISANA